MTDTRIYLKEEAEKIGIFLNGDQLDQFRIYLEFLLETNEKMNLTAIREPAEVVRKHFDLRPAGIIKMMDLRRPIYKQTASYGHFGRSDLDLPWERLDKVEELKAELKI